VKHAPLPFAPVPTPMTRGRLWPISKAAHRHASMRFRQGSTAHGVSGIIGGKVFPVLIELAAMDAVHAHLQGPVTITRDTILHGTVTGDVTVLGGVHLDLLGTVLGNLIVEGGASAAVRGVVADAVINRGGSVEVYGTVGSITGTERTNIYSGSTVEK
jgi:hypothetical protein